MPRPSLRVVSFDLDGTLVDESFSDFFWNELVPRLYAEARGLSFEEAYREVAAAYDEVGPDDPRWYLPAYWVERFGLSADFRELIVRHADRIRLYPDVEEALAKLEGRFKLVIMTNAAREFAGAYCEVLGLKFSRVFSSVSDYGLTKKTPEFYLSACEELGVDPGEVAHAGDNPVHDYEVPRSVGIKAFLLDRRGGRREGSVRDLVEFAEAVLRL